MSRSKATITCYFDVISPYAWIGFEILCRYEKFLPATLKFKPFFLSGIMVGAGNTPPGLNPKKAVYMASDLEKNAKYWDLPIKMPGEFFKLMNSNASLKAQRFLVALEHENPDYLRPAARELWYRIWARDEPIHEIQHIKEVCDKLKIPNSDKLISEINSPKVKDLLKKNTEEALAYGAFGAPWIVLKREGEEDACFFGGDRFPILCNELGIKFQGPLKSKI